MRRDCGDCSGHGADTGSPEYPLVDVPLSWEVFTSTTRSQAPGPRRLLSSCYRTAVLGDGSPSPAYPVPFILALTTLPGGRGQEGLQVPSCSLAVSTCSPSVLENPDPQGTPLPVSQPNGICKPQKTLCGGWGVQWGRQLCLPGAASRTLKLPRVAAQTPPLPGQGLPVTASAHGLRPRHAWPSP